MSLTTISTRPQRLVPHSEPDLSIHLNSRPPPSSRARPTMMSLPLELWVLKDEAVAACSIDDASEIVPHPTQASQYIKSNSPFALFGFSSTPPAHVLLCL
jgi:hypothetical protein